MSDESINTSWPGWETVRLIGRGNFGAVYEIQRKLFDDDEEVEKAALKVISIPQNDSDIEEMYNDGYDEESVTSSFRSHLKSIVAEYYLMRKMNGSTNIVNCDDVRYEQHADGIGWDIYIKMELLTPLAKSLPATVSDAQVIAIAKDMCEALELCSKHNIIHRDIKPQNIFVSPNGDYKLGDFGIAKTVEKTMGGTKTGTYKYMAPEVYSNRPYNSTADIYSLGLVLYWLLNERRMPFMPLPPAKLSAGMDEESRQRRFAGEPIPTPKNGSKELKRIVLKACAFDPKDRYQSAKEMREDLLHLSGTAEPVLDFRPVQKPEITENMGLSDDATVGPVFKQNVSTEMDEQDRTVGPVFDRKKPEYAPTVDQTVGPEFSKKAVNEQSTVKNTEDPIVEQKKAEVQTKRKKVWPTAVLIAVVLLAVSLIAVGACAFFANSGPRTKPTMMEDPSEINSASSTNQRVFGTIINRNQVKTITFLDTLRKAPRESWDISANQDGSVLAWVEENGNLYDLYIAGDGGVTAPENCTGLFRKYIYLTEINFNNCFDTSQVRSMAKMFDECSSLITLDLSEFDTSQVTDMSQMFRNCKSLSVLGVSNFDTTQVVNMAGMFAYCRSLAFLDVAGFDTTQVKCMSRMFFNCKGLFVWNDARGYYEPLSMDIRNWDVSNVLNYDSFVSLDGQNIFLYGQPWEQFFSGSAIDRSGLQKGIVSTGGPNVVLLREDGTVAATGRNDAGQCNTRSWTDIIAVSSSCFHTVGLKSDGTVVATGAYGNHQCEVNTWTDIVQIAAGMCHTVGLKSDGTVVAAGNTDGSQWDYGQCDVSGWTDIIYIAASDYYTIGIKADGTIVETGISDICGGKEHWNNIVAVACDGSRVVGLKADGTVVSFVRALYSDCDYSSWTDIVAIAVGYYHTIGLRADGTVVAAGITAENADDHGCTYYGQCDVEEWSDIVSIGAGINTTVGVREDGTVIVIGEDAAQMAGVQDWQR